MDSKTNIKNKLPFLARPWIPESIVFFMVLWQESFRLSSRTAHRILPVSKQLQHYYYYTFGDFVNGYVMAFIIDGLVNVLFLSKATSYNILGFSITKNRNALLSCLVSMLIVIVFELSQSASTTSDINDIPAGILGAFLYFLIRSFALRMASKYEKQNS